MRDVFAQLGLTVQPVPDFVVYKPPSSVRALIECKQTNDGGTARDKAARYTKLSTLSEMLEVRSLSSLSPSRP